MPEHQNIEYKSSWHDDYLKWVCGFANAQGGRIYIGKDDAATVVGLPDYKKLMEDIVRLFKDRFSEEQLKQLGLNDRQVKAVLYVKEKGKITNKEYQEINSVAKPTATRDLSELTDTFDIFTNTGFGAGSFYELAT